MKIKDHVESQRSDWFVHWPSQSFSVPTSLGYNNSRITVNKH